MKMLFKLLQFYLYRFIDTANSTGNPQVCYLKLRTLKYSSKPWSTTNGLTSSWDCGYKEFVRNFVR